ncbi:hypothetical protein K3N28_07055 [Glycomyces sp. TRM65418]|uniref:hypothetical protein n=1 Tax=Glycomyces sp. TRM65418 TaxID=2867006 RepID=UPI001CE70771|nr:hypothetical protein [Glycomyces sp. TRM65418]MCC3762828.1 hypothetical protein [Glycomyces sp. TRM65418]QZD56856.1 hypothetical protein K3N28_07005 [Glycomyces sp. TRM65418]
MSDDIEALLRSGMAERVDAAPVFDDPGLADAAIAGAVRIRKRRRVGAAASGAGLLVLGAAAFVWHPWLTPDKEGDGTLAADTSPAEAQNELGMEFVVEDEGGAFEVINPDGAVVPLGDEQPQSVFRLADAYVAENEGAVWTTALDGGEGWRFEKADPGMTYLKVNAAGDAFAMATPNAAYTMEEYTLLNASEAAADDAELQSTTFVTSVEATLVTWDASTAVFTTDLYRASGGEAGSTWYFNEEYDLGLESVAAAGFDAAVLVDRTDPNYVCVADMDPGGGMASATEECGPAESAPVEEYLAVASGGQSDPIEASMSVQSLIYEEAVPLADAELGEYEPAFVDAVEYWTDPLSRWQIANTGRTWLLLENLDGEPVLSELEPPPGTLMPVLSYT